VEMAWFVSLINDEIIGLFLISFSTILFHFQINRVLINIRLTYIVF
jgi:hypothetical protein